MLTATDGSMIRLQLNNLVTKCNRKVYTTNLPDYFVSLDSHEWANKNAHFNTKDLLEITEDRDSFIVHQMQEYVQHEITKNMQEECVVSDHHDTILPLLKGASSKDKEVWQIKDDLFAQDGGDAYFVFKCKKVEVVPRKTENCHDHLPVRIKGKNEDRYLSAKDHLLTNVAKEIVCPQLLFKTYRTINNKWVASAPTPMYTKPPAVIIEHQHYWKVDETIEGGLITADHIMDARLADHQDKLKEAFVQKLVTLALSSEDTNLVAKSSTAWKAEQTLKKIPTTLFGPITTWFWNIESTVKHYILIGLCIIISVIILWITVQCQLWKICCACPRKPTHHQRLAEAAEEFRLNNMARNEDFRVVQLSKNNN